MWYNIIYMSDHPLQDIFSDLLSNRELYAALRPVLLLNAWSEIAGDIVAKKTQAVSLNNGMLEVKVSNHSILTELELNKSLLIIKYQKRFGKKIISDINFKYGRLSKTKDNYADSEPKTDNNKIPSEVIKNAPKLPTAVTKGVRQEVLDELEPAISKIAVAIDWNNKKIKDGS